jgi:hypothetical protein
MVPIDHWLDKLEDLFQLVHNANAGTPLCFLIGAGASLSSNAPGTADIVAALRRARPRMFPDDPSVYAKVHQLSADDRRTINADLFGDVVPHIGYRCLAAMARVRPIIIVNLNWDDCPVQACARLGLPADWACAVHLEDTAEVDVAVARLQERGKGLLSVHVHGRILDPDERDPRFGTKETLSFTTEQFEQLQTLLNFSTYVIGTSLSGPHDVSQLVDAMRPPEDLPESRIRRLWVIERGPVARMPNPLTEAGNKLSRALEGRQSTSNFIAAPDVDFDMFMVTLRATEVGYSWEDVKEHADEPLPERSELVPPNPTVVRPLLDGPGLLVGRGGSGKSAVAHQVGHWLSILAKSPQPLVSVERGRPISRALAKNRTGSSSAVIVGDNCFGTGAYRGCAELLGALRESGAMPGVILVSSPSHWFDASAENPELEDEVPMIPFQASQVWEKRALKAYARWRSPHGAENVEEAIERGELTVPKHVEQAQDGYAPGHDSQELKQLTEYLGRLRKSDEEQALALALIRLQDMFHAIPRSQLEESCDADLEKLVRDPWELVAAIWLDDEYLCLARRGAVAALDNWMVTDREWLAGRIAILGERCRWARRALTCWERFADCDPAGESLSQFDAETIELLGPEIIEPALGISPKEAMRVLEVMFEAAPDAWAIREVGFELVRRWDSLRLCPKAQELRDRFLADTERGGLYALFEASLRHGGIGPTDLWSHVEAALTTMMRHLDEDGNRRQVALCFDALLWRKAPTDAQRGRMLLELLLEAAEGDDLLWASCAVAAAYHWQGALRLVEMELPNPVVGLGNVSEAAAREMRWWTEWHFGNQSRNRALASRRYFRSTRAVPVNPDQPRLLSRKPFKRKLPPDWAEAVARVATQMGRFASTAGWAIHWAAIVQSTCGQFQLPGHADIVARAEPDDAGLVSTAITYELGRTLIEELRDKFKGKKGRDAVQRALSGGIELEGQAIRAPRFVVTLDPWREVRRRLGMDADILGDLGLPEDEPWRLVEVARGVRDEVIARGATEEAVDETIAQLAAGDTRLIDAVHSEGGFAERGRKGGPAALGTLPERVTSTLFMAAGVAMTERKRG